MNALVTTGPKPQAGVLASVASRYSMDPEVFRTTLRGTVFTSGTNEEFAAFLVVANEYKLNPLTREIYAFPKKGGGIVPVVSIDGWISLVNSHPQFKGMEFEPLVTDKGALYAYTCRIWRKDREMPTAVTEYLDECIRSTDPWKMKNRMLRHKALIQCARYAFGFSGIYDDDEGAVIAESALTIAGAGAPPPPPPSPSQNRAAVEDALIISETAAGAPPPGQPAAQDAGTEASGAPSGEVPASDNSSEIGINPDDEIANLIDKLAHAKDEATIEEWYVETDIEAALSDFTGYVDKARAVKAHQIDRVNQAAAREAAAAAATAETAPPPGAPTLADDDEGPTPPPPPSTGDDRGFDVDGWKDLTTKPQYVTYIGLICTYAERVGDSLMLETFWNESQPLRAKVMPFAERAPFKEQIQNSMFAINKAKAS